LLVELTIYRAEVPHPPGRALETGTPNYVPEAVERYFKAVHETHDILLQPCQVMLAGLTM